MSIEEEFVDGIPPNYEADFEAGRPVLRHFIASGDIGISFRGVAVCIGSLMRLVREMVWKHADKFWAGDDIEPDIIAWLDEAHRLLSEIVKEKA